MATTVTAAIDAALPQLLVARSGRRPAPPSRRLRALFRELGKASPARNPDDIEDLIWAHWIDNADPALAQMMAEAIDAIEARSLDVAMMLLDQLVRDVPDWAETWNKRATLHFIAGRDRESVDDIVEVVRREPRHFGALSGFGQISLRHGRLVEAKAAFMLALDVNPHLLGLREAIAEIDGALPRRH
jgi:hypothetical protein